MSKEIYPSSYLCDCGHQSDFFENTIREMKEMSRKKKVRLADSAPDEHVIVFYKGEMIDIICPHQKRKSAKMSSKSIPKDVKGQVEEIVNKFNEDVIKNPGYYYSVRYRGRYLYLYRAMYNTPSPVCRLKYTGDTDNWEFAIYKYSDERYDPDEWFFPGSEHVNGTIEGAMRAGLGAYP